MDSARQRLGARPWTSGNHWTLPHQSLSSPGPDFRQTPYQEMNPTAHTEYNLAHRRVSTLLESTYFTYWLGLYL